MKLVTHELRGRRPALRQDEVGHVARLDNRDLVAHGGHPRQVRPVFSGLSRPFFFSPTSIAFITPRPLWFDFASHASCNLTRRLMSSTHSHQETQGSPDSVFAVCDGFGAVRHRREEIQHSVGMRAINGAPDLPLGGSSFHRPLAFSCRRVATRSLAGTLGTRPGATC